MSNIIFDFDGTLFKTETVDVEAINAALTDLGREILSEAEILSYIGLPLSKIAEKCLKTYDKELKYKFLDRVIANELTQIPLYARMYPFALELLDLLKQEGHSLAICSNGSKEYIHAILKKFHIKSKFDIIWHKRYGYSKTRAAKIVSSKLLKNDKTFFVGDRQEDILVGKNNKYISIGITHGFGSIDEVGDADFVANDLHDVHRIINNVERTKK